MRIIKNKFIHHIRCPNGVDDIKKLINFLYQNFRGKFTQIYVSENTAIMENSLFDQMFSWDFIKVISSVEIVAEDKNTYYKVTTKISFHKSIKMYVFLMLFILAWTILGSEYVFMGFLVLLWFAGTYIYTQIASYQFQNLLRNCIEESGLKYK